MQQTFRDLRLEPEMLSVLDRLGFVYPTPIQQQAVTPGIQGRDIIGIAQTGTGKTLAFGIPMIQRLSKGPGRGVVLVPTRELALQVEDALASVMEPFGLGSAVLIGGAPMFRQIKALQKNPRILIATPGRMIDHLEQGNVALNEVSILVLDEADRMLDMGFAPQIRRILKTVPKERQTMLLSATMPLEIRRMVHSYMRSPETIEVARAGTVAEGVSQEIFVIPKEKKKDLLLKILQKYKSTVLIFTQTRISARQVGRMLREGGVPAAEIHSDLTMEQRRSALEGFKDGTHRILVATDIAARGIDVTGIELVINYEVPEDPENYVHRIGRTGRAGQEGHAITLACPDQEKEVRMIESLIRMPIPVSEDPEIPTTNFPRFALPGKSIRRSFGGRRR